MEQKLNVCQQSYTGRTYPDGLNFNQLGLEQHGIKIVPYVTDFDRAELKSFKENHFREWLNSLEKKGTCITLWKGKYKVTICQQDYANMQVVGALFIPNDSMLSLFKHTKNNVITRELKLKAKRMLKDILTGGSYNEPSLLMLLNNTRWNVEILNSNSKRVFYRGRLTETEANDLLTLELNKLKLKWETLKNGKK